MKLHATKFFWWTAARGFTLVEIAVVMVVVGLLMMSMLLPLSAQLEQKAAADTLKRMEDAREALIAFALLNGRLPCPATSGSAGIEAPTGGGVCTQPYDGFLPARTLSIYPQSAGGNALDAWNNPIRYAVSKVTSSVYTKYTPGSAGIKYQVSLNGLGDPGLQPDLRICATASAITNPGQPTATCGGQDIASTTSVVAVIYSTGKNGALAADASSRPDEAANLNADRVFVSHLSAPSGSTGGEFDDILIWISAGTLFNRMIAASVLP